MIDLFFISELLKLQNDPYHLMGPFVHQYMTFFTLREYANFAAAGGGGGGGGICVQGSIWFPLYL